MIELFFILKIAIIIALTFIAIRLINEVWSKPKHNPDGFVFDADIESFAKNAQIVRAHGSVPLNIDYFNMYLPEGKYSMENEQHENSNDIIGAYDIPKIDLYSLTCDLALLIAKAQVRQQYGIDDAAEANIIRAKELAREIIDRLEKGEL